MQRLTVTHRTEYRYATPARANNTLPVFPDLRFEFGTRFTLGLVRLCKLSPSRGKVGPPI